MATGHRPEVLGRRYTGQVGTTRKKTIHFACPCGSLVAIDVYVSIDASSEPELAQRLIAEDLDLNSSTCPTTKETYAVDHPVVYHAPANNLFVLVLPPTLRYRELDERALLIAAITDDKDADIPTYVRDFAVVYGSAGLNHYLEEQAEQALSGSRSLELTQQLDLAEQELVKQREAMAAQKAEFERIASELDRSSEEISERLQSLDDREAALDRRSSELDLRTRALADAEVAIVDSAVPPQPRAERPSTKTDPFERVDLADLRVGEAEPVVPVVAEDEELIAADQIIEETTDAEAEAAAAPVPTKPGEGATRVGGTTDVAIERWIVSREPSLKMVDDAGKVRLAASVSGEPLEGLLTNRLALKLQMHAMPSYPLVSLVIGTPEVLRGALPGEEPFVFHFDIGDEQDRGVLEAFQRRFTFSLEIYDNEYLMVKRRTIAAELEDNVGYVMTAAEEHLSTIVSPSFLKAVIGFEAPEHDRYGWKHPEAAEFRERLLLKLDSARDVRRALAIARRFSDPEQEGYLVLVRGYSLRAWHAQRRRVLERAVECGLWMGSTLARAAVSEGIARSRKDLIKKLQSRFVHLVADQHDLDEETIQDNWSAIERETGNLGMTPAPVIDPGNVVSPQSGEISLVPPDTDSGAGAPIVSGTIAEADPESPSARLRVPVTELSLDELIQSLEDKDLRLEAAVELARQGEERAIGPVFNTLRRMTRGEAVRVLGTTPSFGEPAVAHLIDGLRSRKGFLRQGCALALAVIKREEGIEAVCDLLISEPTEIWREVARALGEVGPVAIMPLASRLASSGNQPTDSAAEVQDRISWALAHIVGNGGSQPVTTLAGGRDPVAATVATRALELARHAESENLQLRGAATPREQTVNRAFSRRFFQALEGSHLGAWTDGHAHEGGDLSGPAMLLDESDLIDLDDADLLDESDLIPT